MSLTKPWQAFSDHFGLLAMQHGRMCPGQCLDMERLDVPGYCIAGASAASDRPVRARWA